MQNHPRVQHGVNVNKPKLGVNHPWNSRYKISLEAKEWQEGEEGEKEQRIHLKLLNHVLALIVGMYNCQPIANIYERAPCKKERKNGLPYTENTEEEKGYAVGMIA